MIDLSPWWPPLTATGVCAVLASGIYRASVKQEAEWRPEAKKHVATLINQIKINPDSRVAASFIYHGFEAIFGKKHWSVRCIIASVFASSLLMIGISSIILWELPSYRIYIPKNVRLMLVIFIVTTLLIPDYLSLYKGRMLLSCIMREPTFTKMLTYFVIDLTISVAISVVFIVSFGIVYDITCWAYENPECFPGTPLFPYLKISASTNIDQITDVELHFFGLPRRTAYEPDSIAYFFGPVVILTTMMTSIWTILTIISSILLKIAGSINPIMRLFRWMYDIEAHPIRMLGRMGQAIIWAAWTVYFLASDIL